jgi:hypothetical protein
VKAFPDTHRVEISLYTALFTGMVAGVRSIQFHLAGMLVATFWLRFRHTA